MRRLLTALVAVSLFTACSPREEAPGRSQASAAATPGAFVRPATLAGEPCGLEVSADHVWILSCSGNLLRLPKSGPGGTSEHLGGEVLALDGLVKGSPSRVWALVSSLDGRSRKGKVVPIDSATGRAEPSVDAGAAVPMSAVESGGALWVAMLDGRLLAVSGDGRREADRGRPLLWAVADGSELWTIAENGDAVRRDAEGTERSTAERFAPESLAAAAAFGSLWAATPSRLLVMSTTTGEIRTLDVGATVNGIEPCGGRVWISQSDFGVRSLTAKGATETAVRLDVAPRYIACDGSRLWVLAEDGRLGSVPITP